MRFHPLLTVVFIVLSYTIHSQNIEQAYGSKPNDPQWVKMLYSKDISTINIANLKKLYKKHYQSHPFVKNKHTQYYKRFVRKYEPYTDDKGFIAFTTFKQQQKQWREYNQQLSRSAKTTTTTTTTTANWEELGPWEYDHYASMEARDGYAPGAAHVRGIEQSLSNPNVLYAATASAGIWKTTDKGINWHLITKNIFATWVTAIEIDPTNENILYAGFSDKIAKTVDGGSTWTFSNTNVGNIEDILVKRNNSNIVFAGGDNGLFKSTDGGTNFTKLDKGRIYEFEEHPTNNNIVYAIQSTGKQTFFLKSTDGGQTFTPRYTGWPGVGAITNSVVDGVALDANEYAELTNNITLGNATDLDFTIEFKIKSAGWTGDPVIFGNKNWSNGTSKGFAVFGTTSGGVGFNIGDGTKRVDFSGGKINDNKWHHVSITFNQDKYRLIYIDGIIVGYNNSATISKNITNSLKTAIFQDGTLSYGHQFAGSIAEIRVFNKEVSPENIKNNYAGIATNSHPDYANLIHHYKIDEESGTTLTDAIGSNNATIIGTPQWENNVNIHTVSTSYAALEKQQRTEISVSPANPDLVLAFASGEVNGGDGTVGIYKSTDAGETFTRACCGTGDGGVASATNKNLVSYNYNLDANGGQYNWDLAFAINPHNANTVIAGGVIVSRSFDGGVNWQGNNPWATVFSQHKKEKYVHADIQDIEYYKNGSGTDLWVATDGGIYYSSNNGDTFEPRMHGIQGTEFWAFNSSSIGDAMIGGAYHNGVLRHYNNLYEKGKNGHGGWFGANGGDRSDGFIHKGDPKMFFINDGMFEFPDQRTKPAKKLPYDTQKLPKSNFGRNMAWVPNQYFEYYVAVQDKVWKTNNNGTKWELIKDFNGGNIIMMKTSENNKNFIALVIDKDGKHQIQKTTNGGSSWANVTPNVANRGIHIDVSDTNENNMWFTLLTSSNVPKVFKTTNGGTSWQNITGTALANQGIASIAYQQGTDGGIYIGTSNAIYYKNNTMADFVLYNTGLPVAANTVRWQFPNYTYQKLRIATYRGAYQSNFYEPSQPIAKPSVNQVKTYCSRDEVLFRDLSFVSNVGRSRVWNFPGGNPATSTEANPKIRYATPGVYDVTLTVTDANGTSTKTLTNFITVTNECEAEKVPGKALVTGSGKGVHTLQNINFGASTDFSVSCWIKTTTTAGETAIITDKNWASGKNKGWILGMLSGRVFFNMSDGNQRRDIATSETFNDNKWHYITLTADRDGVASLYVDGKLKNSTNISAVTNIYVDNPVFMGVDNRQNYPFEGLIDEVKIWNTAISQEHLREQRHLTAIPTNDVNLIAYYQFNRADDKILDRAGAYHAKYINTTSNTNSTAPLGGGKSKRLTVNAGGNYDFLEADIEIKFPTSGTLPNGDVVASKIALSPNKNPNVGTPVIDNAYWIINNYGTNPIIDNPEQILFKKAANVTTIQANSPENFRLFSRFANSDENWGNSIDNAENVAPGTYGNISFSNGVNISRSGQFTITELKSKAPGGVFNNLQLWLKANEGVNTTTTSVNSWNDASGNSLNGTTINSPTLKNNASNFNPAISFNGTDAQYIKLPEGFENFTEGISAYIITKNTLQGNWERFFDLGNGQASDNILLARNGSTNNITFEAYNGGSSDPATVANFISNSKNSLYATVMQGGVVGSKKTPTFYKNGRTFTTSDATNVPKNILRTKNYIGKSNWSSDAYYNGEISEIILYNDSNSALDHQKIQTYLAIKYGITLDATDSDANITEGDYLLSDGTTKIWDYTNNSTYHNDIAAIGRDDVSSLNQKQSKSNNSDAIVTIGIGNIATNNKENTNTFTANKNFLAWGNNNGNISRQTTELPTGATATSRLGREWKVSENGTVNNLTLLFEIPETNITNIELYIDTDGDADFSNATIISGGSIIDGKIAFNGIDLNHNDYFTLGYTFSSTVLGYSGPGGVGTTDGSSQLNLWLDTNTITNATHGSPLTSWKDNSGNLHTVSQNNTAKKAIFNNNAVNGYPSVTFDGIDDHYTSNYTPPLGSNQRTMIAVINNANNNPNINYRHVLHYGDTSTMAAYGMAYKTSTHQAGASGGIGNHYWASGFAGTTGFTPNATIIQLQYYSGVDSLRVNGAFSGKKAVNLTTGNTYNLIVGGRINGGVEGMKGDILETIVFNSKLSLAQKIIIDNYLSAKYNTPLITANFYDEDENGNFDHEVAGIGKASDGSSHKDSQGTGIVRIIAPNTLNDDSFLFWGRNNKTAITFATSDKYTERMTTTWRVSNRNSMGAVTIHFNLNGIDISNKPTCSSIKLLVSNNSNFNNPTVYTLTNTTGNTYTANNVSLSDNDYFTVEYISKIVVDNTQFYNGSGTNSSPNTTDDCYKLLIKSSADGTIILSEDTTVREIEIESNGKLIVNPGVKLQVNNNITNYGEIRLLGSAQLIQTHTGTKKVSGTGRLFKDKKSQLTNVYQSSYWSSPVSSNGTDFTISNVLKDGTTPLSIHSSPADITFTSTNIYDGNYQTSPITISGKWLAKLVNDIDWTREINPNTQKFAPIEGWNMKSSGNPSGQNYTFVGVPNDGNYSSTISSGKLSLLGNPYPSAIDADLFIADNTNAFNGTLYFYDAGNDTSHKRQEYTGGYATRVSGVGTPSGSGNKSPSQHIGVGQAFFVTRDAKGNGTIIFNNAHRRFKNTTNFNKTSSITNFPILRLGFAFTTPENNIYKRELAIAFRGLTNLYENGFDAEMFDKHPTDIALSVANNNRPYVITGIGYFNKQLEIPLQVFIDNTKAVTFSLEEAKQITSNVFIKDSITNTYYNISKNSKTLQLESGNYHNRFYIVFTNNKTELNNEENITDYSELNIFIEKKSNKIILDKHPSILIDKIILYNILGQKITEWNNGLNKKSISLTIPNLKSSVYIIQVKTNKGIVSKKIIIE